VHPRLCISQISSWSWSVEQDLDFYARNDVHTIGVSLRKLDAEGLTGPSRLIKDAALEVADLIGVGPLALDQPDEWPHQQARLLAAVDLADHLGAGCLVVTTGPAGRLTWEEAALAFGEATVETRARAAERGVVLAMEHTNSLRADVGFVHTLRDAIDLARHLGIGVCMEINACWGERDLATTIRDGVDVVRLVQVSDYAVGTTTTPDRLVPGDGDIPLERIVGQVLEAGYEGFFDLELVGPHIDEEGYESAITRSIEYLDRLLRGLDT